MNFRKRSKRDEPEINLIPLIDVFLVIIIFLMVSTTYARYTELQITLPTADAEKAPERPNEVNIAIGADGKYALNGAAIAVNSAATLAEAIRAEALKSKGSGKDPVIIINADAQTTHQSVVTVMEAARLAQIGQITFATQTPSGN